VKAPVLIGVGSGIVLIAAGLITPRLADPSRKRAEKALDQASLALRHLARYSVKLPRLEVQAGTDELEKEERLAFAAESATERLRDLQAEYAQLIRGEQERAKRSGLPIVSLRAWTPDRAGLQQAVAAFRQQVRENDELLKKALAESSAAAGIDANVVGVSQTLGIAEYTRAADLLIQAQQLRIRQADVQAQLLNLAAQWKLSQAWLDYYRALEPGPILTRLQSDLAELADRKTQAADDARVADELTQKERILAQVEQSLKEKRAQLSELEEQGFEAGRDQGERGFPAYRDRYLRLQAELRQLQEQEQELRYGCRQGAELVGTDWASGEIRDGQVVIGLEELQRRLAVAQERGRRLEGATATLETQIQRLSESGQWAGERVVHYQQRLSELEAQQQGLVEELKSLVEAAFNKEAEALRAAENAVRAFGQAQRVADAWFSAARNLQRDKDPKRKNARLALILRDPYFEHVSRSAEASARVLAGRIHAQRVTANRSLIEDLRGFSELYTDPRFTFDPTVFQTQLQTASTAGTETLEKAAQLYTTMADRLSGQPTAWVPLAGLATTYHLMMAVNPDQAADYLTEASDAITKALEKREQSPYLRPLLAYRDHLAQLGKPAGPGVEPPAEQPEEEKQEDFFLEEE